MGGCYNATQKRYELPPPHPTVPLLSTLPRKRPSPVLPTSVSMRSSTFVALVMLHCQGSARPTRRTDPCDPRRRVRLSVSAASIVRRQGGLRSTSPSRWTVASAFGPCQCPVQPSWPPSECQCPPPGAS